MSTGRGGPPWPLWPFYLFSFPHLPEEPGGGGSGAHFDSISLWPFTATRATQGRWRVRTKRPARPGTRWQRDRPENPRFPRTSRGPRMQLEGPPGKVRDLSAAQKTQMREWTGDDDRVNQPSRIEIMGGKFLELFVILLFMFYRPPSDFS